MRLTLWYKDLDHASKMQRYAMFQHIWRPFLMTVTHSFNTLVVLVCLWHGQPVIRAEDTRILRSVVLCLGLLRLFVLYEDIRSVLNHTYLSIRRRNATGVWMSHHFSRDALRPLLPEKLGGCYLGFGVSGVEDKPQTAVKERDLGNRPSLFTRLWVLHCREGILWHLVLFLVTVRLVAWNVQTQIEAATVHGEVILNKDFWLRLITSVGFPGFALIENVPYYLTPLFYVISPPSMPGRRKVMRMNTKTGHWKPLKQYTKVKYTIAS